MAAATITEQEGADSRKVVTIDSDFHQRIKIIAAMTGVQIKDVIHTILDYTLPRLENGELEIQRPTILEGGVAASNSPQP